MAQDKKNALEDDPAGADPSALHGEGKNSGRDILKSWIPHITILEPEAFRQKLLAEVKDWVKMQEKVV